MLTAAQSSLAAPATDSSCKATTHINGEDTIFVTPGSNGKCVYCLRPEDWAKSVHTDLALNVCGDEAAACLSAKSQCDSLRLESATQIGTLTKRVLVLDSAFRGQEASLKMVTSQKDLKDSIAKSYSQQLTDQKSLTNTWRLTSFGLVVVVVLEGFIIYWTNK